MFVVGEFEVYGREYFSSCEFSPDADGYWKPNYLFITDLIFVLFVALLICFSSTWSTSIIKNQRHF